MNYELNGRGWVYHFLIYLFICWTNRMANLFLCYHSTALCTSKSNISASAICYLWRFINLLYRQAFICFSCYFGGLSCSLHFSTPFAATCSQPTTRRQLTGGASILSYCFLYSFRSLRITVVVDRDHLYLNQE